MKLFGRKKRPGANKKNHFYLRDASREELTRPIHIHFDSYEPALKMGNKTFDNPCTFLVTVDSPNFGPQGLTCMVSGINHKLSYQGVINGVVAHVNMVRYEDDDSLKRVYVQLLEDGCVVGQLITDERCEEITNLDDVFFMAGDTVYLDGMGNPYDSNKQPNATREQELFLETERRRMINAAIDS